MLRGKVLIKAGSSRKCIDRYWVCVVDFSWTCVRTMSTSAPQCLQSFNIECWMWIIYGALKFRWSCNLFISNPPKYTLLFEFSKLSLERGQANEKRGQIGSFGENTACWYSILHTYTHNKDCKFLKIKHQTWQHTSILRCNTKHTTIWLIFTHFCPSAQVRKENNKMRFLCYTTAKRRNLDFILMKKTWSVHFLAKVTIKTC